MAQAVPFIAAAQAVYSGYTGYQNARAERDEARANARESYAAARRAADAGALNELAVRRQGRQAMGALRAALGQAGIGYGGSARDIMRESAGNAEYDAMIARYEGLVEARGYTAEGMAYDAAASNAKRAATGAVLGGVLGTVGSVAQWKAGKTADAAAKGLRSEQKKTIRNTWPVRPSVRVK